MVMQSKKTKEDCFEETEVARRRDEVIRRMANTPPQPRVKTPAHPRKKVKQAAENPATRKPDADDKDV